MYYEFCGLEGRFFLKIGKYDSIFDRKNDC